MEELIKFLLQQNRDLSAQVVALSQLIVELHRPPPLPQLPEGYWNELNAKYEPSEFTSETTVSSSPLFMSDDEQEARWLHNAGLINKNQLEDILAQADFENSTVEVDYEP